MKKTLFKLGFILFSSIHLFAEDVNPITEQREGWFFDTRNTTSSSEPSSLKYFKFYDIMPDQIAIKAFDKANLTALSGKKLYVGYGMVDPSGKDCKIFPKEATGHSTDITVCLPWWRIEREYIQNNNTYASAIPDFINNIKKQKPPLVVNVCEDYESPRVYEGGHVTCTSYFDRYAAEGCSDNPQQAICFVNNCGPYLEENCTLDDIVIGRVEELDTARVSEYETRTIVADDSKVNLATSQYTCPEGAINDGKCLKEQNVLMFPYECKADDPATEGDDSEYVYCDKEQPIYDGENITGFKGKCGSTDIVCKADSFQRNNVLCVEPIYDINTETKRLSTTVTRNYRTRYVDVISGEDDIYSSNESCLRANTIEEARDRDIFVRITGDGTLDDDVYVLKHKEDGTHEKIYCNMQHAPGGLSTLTKMKQCLANDGLPSDDDFANRAFMCGDNYDGEDIRACLEGTGVELDVQDIANIDDCIQQIDGNATKFYNGVYLGCLRNSGSYSFNQEKTIKSTDIVTVQENSEAEYQSGVPFSLGRRHYRSTQVTIDGITVAPRVSPSDYPFYPSDGSNLKTWDNTTATMAILFPFAGAYEIFFYNKDGMEVVSKKIDIEDFKTIATYGNLPLNLGKDMQLSPGIIDDIYAENGTISTYNANREDPWVEWGGGVYGGKNSLNGRASASPNDSYVKENAIYNIIVKDLLTGAVTPVPMVYPLPYPNRVFVSKLKVYEHREYRCYDPFPAPDLNIDIKTRYACSTDSAWVDYKSGKTTDTSTVDLWADNAVCQQNCRAYNSCSPIGENYTCTQSGGTDIGGDIEGNVFSSQATCDSKCFTQNSCESYNDSDCKLVEEELAYPISDIDGKTIYKQKTVSYVCESTSKKQIGCNKYEVSSANGDVDYNFGAVGYETKDFSADFEAAVAMANMIEVGSLHIWSGWPGKCVQGMRWDFSYLSDPMTLISYAMSAYNTWDWMTENVGWAKDLSESFDDFTSTISTKMDKAVDSLSDAVDGATSAVTTPIENMASEIGIAGGDVAAEGATAVAEGGFSSTISNIKTSVSDTIDSYVADAKELLADTTGIQWDADVEFLKGLKVGVSEITQGDLVTFGVQSAMLIAAPTEEDYLLADRMLEAYNGNDSDSELQAYNSCMASIGAALPNLVGWSSGVIDGNEELIAPWEHPLRMTPEQLASIAVVTGEDYVMNSYVYDDSDPMLFSVKATRADAYIRAARTICMGTKVAQAAEHIDQSNNMDMGALGIGIAKLALNVICPPCGFAVTIIMDLYTNVFSSVDTCNNEEDAMGWDINHFKTHKFLTHDQCKLTRTYCDKKVFLLGCVRDGYDYCCYDQITTRIFAEGLKEQMFAPNDPAMWNSCNDITINDLKNISFRECKLGETPYVNKCFSIDKYSEFKQALFKQATKGVDMTGLTNQVLNSMAIETN